MMRQRLVIFTRFPEPHKAKTRLIPALGPDGAAQLQRDLTRHTLAWVQEFAANCPGSKNGTGTDRPDRSQSRFQVEVRFEGGDAERMATAFGDGFPYRPQGTGDLGCRMERAFAEAFVEGTEQTVIIGTDCPEMTSAVIAEAFDRLATCDVVLGPARDGGYYLIGLRRAWPELFQGVRWGSHTVLDETLHRAYELSLQVSLLDMLSDVDRPEDLAVWHRVKDRFGIVSAQPRISVVIPTLNESNYLPRALASLRRAENYEVIVVDGGSQDGTDRLATFHGSELLQSRTGRAWQMNAGAAAATGDILLFLHADTTLPDRFDESIRHTLSEPGVVAGAFQLRIDAPCGMLRFIEWAVNLRSRSLQMPYGDQAIFLKAETFRELGAFPELPILEDFEFVRRLRRCGRIAIIPLPAITSARRWQALGPWRTVCVNQMIIAGYYLGISPERLARFRWSSLWNRRRCPAVLG